MVPARNGRVPTPSDNDRALLLLAHGQVGEALSLLQNQAWQAPSYKAFYNYAVALRHAGRFSDAMDYLLRAINVDMAKPQAWLTLANISTDTGLWDKAIQYYEGAYARIPMQAPPAMTQQVAIGYAQALLRARRFHDAWKYWELGRYCRSWAPLPSTLPWGGEESDCVLVVCEGGYGDAMLFARWLPFVAARARKVKLLIWRPMMAFRDWRALGVDEVLLQDEPVSVADVKHTISWMSLPAVLGMAAPSDIPTDTAMTGLWEPVSADRVGFCWRAEENGQIRRSRSLSQGDAEAIVSALAPAACHSLVPHGKNLVRPDDEPWPANVIQDDSLLNGWAATAALIRSCRFIVSVDTAVAHLAGLCGVPTLLLLPCASDWKWGTADNTPVDPWYGSHMRYFRNKDPLKWDVAGIVEAASCITQPS